MDAVDATLVEIKQNHKTRLISAYEHPLPTSLRERITNAGNASADSIHDVAILDNELAELYAHCVQATLEQAEVSPDQVHAIGSHGQTVRHCPDCNPPYSVQLGNADRLAEMTGISTVSNFRQRDMAAGGQGAPLAPIFHHHLFANDAHTVVCVNLGGIANISILNADGAITGFDTGPANTLMDKWTAQHHSEFFDRDAQWARTGNINDALLQAMLSENWLERPPPKSTGPELFNMHWLQQHLHDVHIEPEDVQRSLCEFSAVTIANAIHEHASDCRQLIVCGGGAYNPLLVERIQHHLSDIEVSKSDIVGIAPEWIEACMFAWLAYRTLNGLPGNIPAVTGARHEVVLGAIHHA